MVHTIIWLGSKTRKSLTSIDSHYMAEKKSENSFHIVKKTASGREQMECFGVD